MNIPGGPGERVFLQTPHLLVTTVRIAVTGGATFPTAHVTTVQPRHDDRRWGWLVAIVIGLAFEVGFAVNLVSAIAGEGGPSAPLAILSALIGGAFLFLGTKLPRAYYTARVTVGPAWTQLYRGTSQAEADAVLAAIHAAVGQRW